MSSLIVSHDLRLVMLEVAVENLYMPRTDVLDETIMKKTIIMFRMLDDEWTPLLPNRPDYRSYRGSNYENERFHGGRSVLFSIPESVFEEKVSDVDVQLHVYKEASRYFEMNSRRNFGFTLVRVDDLFNGIIKDLRERRELADYMSSSLDRQPVSRATRGIYPLLGEDLERTDATIELYVRISYLGKCITTEIHSAASEAGPFYAREETDAHYPYQFREVTEEELQTGCWGSATILSPEIGDRLICQCKKHGPDDGGGAVERVEGKIAGTTKRSRDKSVGKGAGKSAGKSQGKDSGRDKGGKDKRGRKRDIGRTSGEKRQNGNGSGNGDDEDEELRIKKLLALLKASRGARRTGTVGVAEKPKKVCLTPQSPRLCSPSYSTTCRYLLPCGFYPILCERPFTYCYPTAYPITCPNRARTRLSA